MTHCCSDLSFMDFICCLVTQSIQVTSLTLDQSDPVHPGNLQTSLTSDRHGPGLDEPGPT